MLANFKSTQTLRMILWGVRFGQLSCIKHVLDKPCQNIAFTALIIFVILITFTAPIVFSCSDEDERINYFRDHTSVGGANFKTNAV